MTFFSRIKRLFPLFGFLGVCACSSMDDSGLYGYEEEFIIPDPDMVPVMPDDKPGQTVDEMLTLPSPSITIKKASYDSVPETDQDYQQAGRFGSKEKISLRKGLNIPESGIVYGPSKRRNAEEIRSLEVKKQEKDEVQVISEEEILAQIIAPKTTEVKMIEVVPALPEVRPAETTAVQEPASVPEPIGQKQPDVKEQSLVASVEQADVKEQTPAPAPVVKAVETASVTPKPLDLVAEPAEKTPADVLPIAPLVRQAPEEKITLREIKKAPEPESEDRTETVAALQEEEIVLIPPVKFVKINQEEEEPIVLIPPQKKRNTERLHFPEEERIVLIPPKRRDDPSVEVFLDE